VSEPGRAYTMVGPEISDGMHTFQELKAHCEELFLALCRQCHADNLLFERGVCSVWRSVEQSDGTIHEGYFLLGIGRDAGDQITYLLPIERWDDASFAQTIEQAPPSDGHTSTDILARLRTLICP
jgi:hypothetical protein